MNTKADFPRNQLSPTFQQGEGFGGLPQGAGAFGMQGGGPQNAQDVFEVKHESEINFRTTEKMFVVSLFKYRNGSTNQQLR